MNNGKRTISLLMLALVVLSPAACFGLDTAHASAEIQSDVAHIRPGSDLTFKMVLDDPLPEGARFDVRLSPVAVNQQMTVSSAEPANKERTEFILHAKLPEGALPGEWHISTVYLFLAGSSWTGSTLATNDMRFVVEGPKVEIPTKGTATIIGK
jgi:hypothetical protein